MFSLIFWSSSKQFYESKIVLNLMPAFLIRFSYNMKMRNGYVIKIVPKDKLKYEVVI